jgi:hypothetical protein
MMKFLTMLLTLLLVACDGHPAAPTATTGVRKATAEVQVQANGLTIEQDNIKRRLEGDNQPGSVKHLYVISAYSGDVLLYSTVKGKVTSSGKRLTPYSVAAQDGQGVSSGHQGIPVDIGGTTRWTSEVLQDDGTYGSSVDYIFWWDSKGNYHQHYITGGQIVHVSDTPLRVGKVIINVEGE